MSDKLKQFIDKNREAFDTEAPHPKSWDNLQQKIGNSSKVVKFQVRKSLLWAASFAGMILLSIALYTSFQKKQDSGFPGSAGTQDEIVDMLDPMQARQINQYQEIIELKESELKLLEKEQPELYKQFITDINELDSIYTVLKKKLTGNPNKELLLEAMINNLRLQSDLLSRQLKVIKEIKQKSTDHEKQVI